MITGAEFFVKALKAEGVDTLFAYPGGQAVDLFDALYPAPEIELIVPRHEQGLVHAADGYARSTGKTGVCLVTSGPGATNLVTGIATANYDSVPLVCFTGQVPTHLIGSDAFQEVDIVGITRSISKYAVTVRRREDLGAVIKRAFLIAKSGKPGVVVVDLPKDIQQAAGGEDYPSCADLRGIAPTPPPDPALIRRAMERLHGAKRPLFLVGGGVHRSGACAEMLLLAERTGVPVITTIMGKGAIPSDHALYIGNIGIHGCFAANTAVGQCDVLFSIGTRFNDRITGTLREFAAGATVIHVDIDPASISKNIIADIPIHADAKSALSACLSEARRLELTDWMRQLGRWQREHPLQMPQGGLTPQRILQSINRLFPKAIIATDVGQNQMWATQFLSLGGGTQLLTSGGLGTMGYGFPAAIGAKLGNPETDVLVIAGDGGIQMNIQELATAVAYELPILICILNNGYLGNVRQWQELYYNRRYAGTCTRYRKTCSSLCSTPRGDCPEYTPDFVRLAESYGAKGVQVTASQDIEPALLQAGQNTKAPTIIEFLIGREENVMPIVPPGEPLYHMMLQTEERL